MRRGLGLAGAAVVAALASCGGAGGVSTSDVVIEHDVARREWVASGGAATSWLPCTAGSVRETGFSAPDGGELSLGDFNAAWDAAVVAEPPDRHVDFLLVVECSCPDGSGWFTVQEELRDGGAWSVLEGSEGFDALAGGGTIEVDRDRPGAVPAEPRTLVLTGELSG